jgi:hypothetical protein
MPRLHPKLLRIVHSNIASGVRDVYLLRSTQYQICSCGVLSRSCTSMRDLHEPILWDHGEQHGQESEEGESKEEDRQEEEVGFAATLLRHVKARARLCHRKADIAAA